MNFSVGTSMCFIGPKKSGKSCAFKAMCIRKGGLLDKHDFVFIFCPLVNRDFYATFIESKFIIQGLDKELLDKITSRQAEIRNTFGSSRMPKILCCFDDIFSSRKARLDVFAEELLSVSRHYNISVVFLSQSAAYLKPLLRNTQIISFIPSGVFLHSDRKLLIDSILLNFKLSEEQLHSIFEKTPKYTVILCDMFRKTLDKYLAPRKLINYELK